MSYVPKFSVQLYHKLKKYVKNIIMSLTKNEDTGQVISIKQIKSAFQEAAFQSAKGIVETWMKTKSEPGKEMDSVIFNEERFELIVDTRGYRPEDLKCTVGTNNIEITAQRQEVSGGAQRCMSTARNYQLPQQVVPQQAMCCMSSEGILLVAVPWQK